MSEEPRKRSRFDQTEPEPKRASRFDRRSRSPSSRKSESRRSRSPVERSSATPDTESTKADPAAAAAAAAARINAQLQAKKGVQHADVPPIQSSSGDVKSPSGSNVNGDIYQQDGDFIKDIEVNDLRNRYTLTKGPTQKMIKDETGADVTTRGSYYPDKSMATAANPPLYLHVTSLTKEGLEKAVAKIEELMKQELPNLVDERRFRRPREEEKPQVERDELGRRKWPEEKIPIDLEPIPGFNLRAQVVGHGGAYVKHIQGETRCRVQIKGRGSGFTEHGTGVESDEPMYLHVAGPDPNEVQRAKELCEDLLANVKEQYQLFKERGAQRHHGYGGGGGGGGGHHGNGGYGHRDGRGGDRDGYGGQHASGGHAQASGAGSPTDYSAQYAQYYAQSGQDPYAAYGGYQAYMQMYYQWYQQQAQQQQADPNAAAAAAAPGMASSPGAPGAPGAPPGSDALPPPPPPPPSNDSAPPPPPPPPSGSPPGGYGSVPPPPGL